MSHTTNMNKKTTMTYTIKTETRTRMAGGILEGCPMYEVKYTQYNILQDGQLVTFVYDETDVAPTIDRLIAGTTNGYGTRFD